jgi:polar amino acid transport system substrate-binding protein
MIPFFTLIIVTFFILTSVTTRSQVVQVVGNNSFMPFSYPDENNQANGISVIIVQSLFTHANILYEIKLYPLQRAILMAEEPNVFCFAIFRTPERESLYKWVVPLTPPIRSVFIRLQSRTDINITTIEEAKKIRIGVVDGNNLHTLLLKYGFKNSKQLQPVTTNEQNYRKLFAGRIDVMAVRESSITTELKALGFSRKDIEVVYILSNDGPAWMITSHETSDETVIKIRDAFNKMGGEKYINYVTQTYLNQFR